MRLLFITVIGLILSTSSIALINSSVVVLPAKGYIRPQPLDPQLPPELFTVSLDKLIKNVQYDVTCIISNNNLEPVDMRLDVNQPLGGGYGLFTLNGNELDNNQGTIPPGDDNLITVPVALYGNGSSIVFQNLDFHNSVLLISCIARPIVKPIQ